MKKVVPLPEWKKGGTCYSSNTTTSAPHFVANAARQVGPLFRLWLEVLKRSPQLIIGARICRGSIAWLIFPGSTAAATHDYLSFTPANLWGWANVPSVKHNPYRADFATRPIFGNGAAVFLRDASKVSQLDWLLWRGATWSYVAYIAVGAFALRRKNRAALSMAAIVAAQQLMVLSDNPVQLFRYMATPLFIGPMLIPLFCARNRQPPEAATSDQPDGDGASAGTTVLTGARSA
jgi:hypothetical protein